MRKALAKFEDSALRKFVLKHQKYAPITFFIGGFIFDTLTLGRIDRLYDLTVLCLYMLSLTVVLYLYNLADDGKWENTLLEKYEVYFPSVIQFFFGGLSSAFVIYFSRSVSPSKTIAFFAILLVLFTANEFLKQRISNKYLQFSVYFFVNFIFFTCLVPVFSKEMNTSVFVFSGLVSLIFTLLFITLIYIISPSTRAEIHIFKTIALVAIIYMVINIFYFLKLIPPVPLALDTGLVAHNVQIEDNHYVVTYEADKWYVFWRKHKLDYMHTSGDNVYVFTSIFAPTDIEKLIFHRWKWYDGNASQWKIVEDISYEITGGRDNGYRGYTFKNNVKQGKWQVEVITEEELVIGVVDFEVIMHERQSPQEIVTKKF